MTDPQGLVEAAPRTARRLSISGNPLCLRALLPEASFVDCADIPIRSISDDSRKCLHGDLFVAIPGTKYDGTNFSLEAIRNGASAILTEKPLPHVSIPQCVVSNVRHAFAVLCDAMTAHPARSLKIVGVTGTNGKTTITWLLRSIFRTHGLRTGLLGTIEYDDGVETAPSCLTTPDALSLHSYLAQMRDRGTTHIALEISSHALDQSRLADEQLDVAIVANITQDHFDYHGDYDSYLSAKSKILDHCKQDALVVLNVDDPGSASLLPLVPICQTCQTFGLNERGTIRAEIVTTNLSGTTFRVFGDWFETEIETSLIGRHNVSNCLAAISASLKLGIPLEIVAEGIRNLKTVPGRLERVDCGQAFDLFVDYAHTDDALRRVVRCLKELSQGRVICVFGAGGDRDRSKRPLLGMAAAEADIPVVTSDNPRTEDPDRIIEDILAGFRKIGRKPYVEVDRKRAIRWALDEAEQGDCVLIAGKGHETYQVLGSERVPFDDREISRRIFSEMEEASSFRAA